MENLLELDNSGQLTDTDSLSMGIPWSQLDDLHGSQKTDAARHRLREEKPMQILIEEKKLNAMYF